MFTLQELLWLKDLIINRVYTGTYEQMMIEAARSISVIEKIDALLADHPVDEEEKVKEGKPPPKKKDTAKTTKK